MDDFLVEVWRRYPVGRDDDTRNLLARAWSWGMDGVSAEEHLRVALRLIDRLGFVTDDPDAWEALPLRARHLPAEFARATEPGSGFCWTLDPEVAAMYADREDLAVTTGLASKGEVLAYITGYGEQEIVVRREHVR